MSAAPSRRPRRLVMTAWLMVVWVALWGDVSAANLMAGFVLGSLLVTVFPLGTRGIPGGFRPLAAAHFVLYFLWKLVEASAVVSWEVVTPRNWINEGIVAVPIRGVSDTLTTMVANVISLTPGTLTLEIRQGPTVLYVHVLHLRDIDAVRRDVQRLELLAMRAFGSAAAIAATETDFRAESLQVPTPSPATIRANREEKGQR